MSLELPQRGSSSDNPRHMFHRKKLGKNQIPKNLSYVGLISLSASFPSFVNLAVFSKNGM